MGAEGGFEGGLEGGPDPGSSLAWVSGAMPPPKCDMAAVCLRGRGGGASGKRSERTGCKSDWGAGRVVIRKTVSATATATATADGYVDTEKLKW